MRDRYLAAAREAWNVLLLGGATIVSLAWQTPVPLWAALGYETLYLALLPRSRWYDARLSRRIELRRYRQRRLLRLQTLPCVRPGLRTRYDRLEALRAGLDAQIVQHYPRWVDEMDWLRELRFQLDELLEKFLHFALREAQFRADLEAALRHLAETGYGPGMGRAILESQPSGASQLDARGRGLAGVLPPPAPFASPIYPASLATTLAQRMPEPPTQSTPLQRNRDDEWTKQIVREILAGHAREMADLGRMKERERDVDTIEVLDARLEMLHKRRVQTEEVERILTNLNHQLRLVEDAFSLISNELSSRPPQQIVADVQEVVGQSESLMRVLKEVLPDSV